MKKNLVTVKCVHESGKILFYDYKAFLNLKVSQIDDYLDISSSERVDLDLFLIGHLIFRIVSVNHLEAAQIIR